jgi:hypothetical protein
MIEKNMVENIDTEIMIDRKRTKRIEEIKRKMLENELIKTAIEKRITRSMTNKL